MKMEDNCFIFNTFLVYQLFLIILMYMSNFTLFIHGHHVILAKILFCNNFNFLSKNLQKFCKVKPHFTFIVTTYLFVSSTNSKLNFASKKISNGTLNPYKRGCAKHGAKPHLKNRVHAWCASCIGSCVCQWKILRY